MHTIFGIGDYDNVWQLRQFLGLSSIRRLVECRRERDLSMDLLTARNMV